VSSLKTFHGKKRIYEIQLGFAILKAGTGKLKYQQRQAGTTITLSLCASRLRVDNLELKILMKGKNVRLLGSLSHLFHPFVAMIGTMVEQGIAQDSSKH
jgi:hypothetical protein